MLCFSGFELYPRWVPLIYSIIEWRRVANLVALETAHLKNEIKINKANEYLRDGLLEKLLGGGGDF